VLCKDTNVGISPLCKLICVSCGIKVPSPGKSVNLERGEAPRFGFLFCLDLLVQQVDSILHIAYCVLHTAYNFLRQVAKPAFTVEWPVLAN
jgi:hypothetical protein